MIVRRLLPVIVAGLMSSGGCMSLGGGNRPTDDVATSRDLACQGVAAIESNEWRQAENLLRQAVEASPSDPVSRRHLAEVLWQRGDRTEALREMETAVHLEPDDASLLVKSGEMLLSSSTTEQALERANRAIGLDPRLASAWALRGRVYWQMQKLDRALADLQRALQFAPGSADVLLDLAALHRERGKHQRCLTTLHHLYDSYSPGEEPQFALYLEGMTLAELGRWPDAVDRLAVASERGAPDAEILYQLARAEMHAGDRIAATSSAREALALNAHHTASRELLAQLADAEPGATSRLR